MDSTGAVAAIAALAGSLITATLTFITKNRRASSEIGLTERRQLVQEASMLREQLKEELGRLAEDIRELRTKESTLLDELSDLKKENAILQARVAELEIKNTSLLFRVEELEDK